jgi:hypothetical protein
MDRVGPRRKRRLPGRISAIALGNVLIPAGAGGDLGQDCVGLANRCSSEYSFSAIKELPVALP